eukprot:TRINITY_DN4090_c0_g1_i2.p1 TRINITY_DN4090_c0_g1~~TRINITY_DN4090_c0_g1_i2.p1  ORF type:complete len:131 (+),score=32.17 TRINITY_DN4090_c0_g1_i2:126-518(+)
MIFAGIGGAMLIGVYYIVESLVGKDTPQKAYDESLEIIKTDTQIASFLGEPITGYQMGSDRVTIVSHQYGTTEEGEECLKVMFRVKGTKVSGMVVSYSIKRDGKYIPAYIQLGVVQNKRIVQSINVLDTR